MQPLSSFTASGQASSVTPGASISPSPSASSPRQPAASRASAASSTPDLCTFMALLLLLCRPALIAERPALPVVADPDPDAEQAARLEQQEADDEQPVEDLLQLEN